jgi:hypothetical protein
MSQDIRKYLPVTDLHFEGYSGGLHCYFIPAPQGLRPDSYDSARVLLIELVSYFISRLGCNHESFIQMDQIREQASTNLFSENARHWMPETGLGVWLHRPAPRMLKMEDMENIDSATGTGPLLNSVFRVTADANARLEAMTTMVGTGSGLQIISHLDSTKLLPNMKEVFLSFIHDRVFRIFPWYVPLIGKAVLVEPIEPLTADAMRGIRLYIRESQEDGGILILSIEPLEDVFALLGCKQTGHGHKPKWKLGD